MEHLSREFWSKRYADHQTGWDLGAVSPPIKTYFEQIDDKSLQILIPGCGNGYEAEYLHHLGFENVHVLDFASEPLKKLKERVPSFPDEHIFVGDFFEHQGKYDIIVEQTLFCAIHPSQREAYAKNVKRLLKDRGKLVGLLFDTEFDGGPPYGGCKEEYMTYFNKYFSKVSMGRCYNSIPPRMGKELFVLIS